MGNWVLIAISVIFLAIPITVAIYKLFIAATGDKITFIKGDKKITISSKLNIEDRKKLLDF